MDRLLAINSSSLVPNQQRLEQVHCLHRLDNKDRTTEEVLHKETNMDRQEVVIRDEAHHHRLQESGMLMTPTRNFYKSTRRSKVFTSIETPKSSSFKTRSRTNDYHNPEPPSTTANT